MASRHDMTSSSDSRRHYRCRISMNSSWMVFREIVRHSYYYLGVAELDDHRHRHRIYHVVFQHRVTSEEAATGHHPPHASVTCSTRLHALAAAHRDIVTCLDK